MTWVSRRALVSLPTVVCAVALCSIVSACSSGSADSTVGTSGQASFISVDTSSAPVIIVQNRTAQPLIDINITLKSGVLSFTDRISRLEANERRPVREGDFMTRDGTAFSTRITTPKSMSVTAKDPDGKQLEANLRWQ
jgi:hypothetical protein